MHNVESPGSLDRQQKTTGGGRDRHGSTSSNGYRGRIACSRRAGGGRRRNRTAYVDIGAKTVRARNSDHVGGRTAGSDRSTGGLWREGKVRSDYRQSGRRNT